MKGFLAFIREHGVLGLAIGFMLGTATSDVVASLVSDLINPLLGLLFGSTDRLSQFASHIGDVTIAWGRFLTISIDFLIVLLVAYGAVRFLHIKPTKK